MPASAPTHALLLALFGAALAMACTRTDKNPDHCAHAAGDQTCQEVYASRPYCDLCSPAERGCVAELPTAECHSPCGERSPDECEHATGDGDGDMTGDGDPNGDGDMTGDGDPMPCMDDDDCSAATPFCDLATGTCVTCELLDDGDQACAAADPNTPVCLAEVGPGACVQCTPLNLSACDGLTPVCDGPSHTCIACTDHDQCPQSACNLDLGNCMDPQAVVHVDGDGGQDFLTLSAALTAHADAPELTLIVHHKDGDAPYTESVLITGERYVAILAAPTEEPVVTGTGGNPSLRVEGAATLYLRGVSASGTQNTGRGLEVHGARAVVQQCTLVGNTGGGIHLDADASLWLENSFVGGPAADVPLIALNGGTMHILYSTVGATALSTTAMECADGTGSTVRNSIVLFNNGDDPEGGELICPGIELIDNVLEGNFPGNVSVGNMSTTWFTNEDGGFNAGNFFLSGTHPEAIATAATWQLGDPTTDIEGDPRPTTDGSPDFAGADVIP
jgi:hypothetical protein